MKERMWTAQGPAVWAILLMLLMAPLLIGVFIGRAIFQQDCASLTVSGDQKYDVPYEPREAQRAYERKPDHLAPGQPAARNEKRADDRIGIGAKERP